jgi:hypothetical protein
VFTLLFAAFGAQALAAPQVPDVTFTLACPGGISASGHEAGWGGALLIEAGSGVPVPGVASAWAFDQETYRNGDHVASGSVDFPGVHSGAVTGCMATLWWNLLGYSYRAELTNMEVTFRGAPA